MVERKLKLKKQYLTYYSEEVETRVRHLGNECSPHCFFLHEKEDDMFVSFCILFDETLKTITDPKDPDWLLSDRCELCLKATKIGIKFEPKVEPKVDSCCECHNKVDYNYEEEPDPDRWQMCRLNRRGEEITSHVTNHTKPDWCPLCQEISGE
jgi:hypothetical protein